MRKLDTQRTSARVRIQQQQQQETYLYIFEYIKLFVFSELYYKPPVDLDVPCQL